MEKLTTEKGGMVGNGMRQTFLTLCSVDFLRLLANVTICGLLGGPHAKN